MMLLLTLASLLFSGCQLYKNDYRDTVLEYAMITDSDDLSVLDTYPNLEYVDLRGSTCYDAILAYAESHPDVTVRYNITFGNNRYAPTEAEIVLNAQDVDFDLLLNNLKYLSNLEHVQLTQLTYTNEQLDKLANTYPNVSFTYTVALGGERYDQTVQELDLHHLTPDEIDETIEAISMLPQLRQVNLVSQSEEDKLTAADIAKLMDACPNVLFNYEFNLFGKRLSTLTEEVTFRDIEIGNEGIAEIRKVMPLLKNCRSFRLDDCGIDNEVAAQLCADFPEQNIAWRVFAGKYTLMTDEEMIRMPNSLSDDHSEVLKYCTKVKYMDLQGTKITNIAFAEHMPLLECVVLSSSKVSDISPLANCQNLTWLEIYNTPVRDLQCLSNLRNLKYLNIACTLVSDLSPLNEVPLERFNSHKSRVSRADLQTFIDKNSDCFVNTTANTVGYGWRYEDVKMKQPFPYYAHMQEVFRYNEKGYTGNRKEN